MSIIVGSAIAVGSSLLNQKTAARTRKLASDQAEAQNRNHPADRDYLAYRAGHGGDVTRYEYDNLRRPLEGQSPQAQFDSGLFPVSRPVRPTATAGVIGAPSNMLQPIDFIGPPESRAPFQIGNALPWIIGGLAALALGFLVLRKGR